MKNDRRKEKRTIILASAIIVLTACFFVLAAATFPGGDYNPCLRMLSALGRTEVRMVTHPLSMYFFMAGMFVSAAGVLALAGRLGLSRSGGAAVNAGGLVAIALVPENICELGHNAGCWLAVIGGGMMFVGWLRTEPVRRVRLVWLTLIVAPLLAIGTGLVLHAVHLVPFAPWVPTAQKGVILSFVAWIFGLSVRPLSASRRCVAGFALLAPLILALALFVRPSPRLVLDAEDATPVAQEVLPLSEDELAGLAWLEYVMGPLSEAEEKSWWRRGKPQYSIFSKRYNIAFAGYAAAAIGQRGGADVRARVGRILGHCIERMLDPDVWGYSQSKNYWGRKPWAPDPCYRENVMYTGHLLQLLAYYELFTGDMRYHRMGGGWDFVWTDGRRVHYDVEKLIEVTTLQMRKGPNGGLTCEPGLMFFACNNHPHVALAIFKALGYGDWMHDAKRWESWSLDRLVAPILGGGAVGLVYHVRSNLVYPRGQNAFDGWSLLWYEAWASDRRVAKALWRKAAAELDWSALETADDTRKGRNCCDPDPVAPSVSAIFLAAAARACDDPATAERLETIVDARYLRRENGRLWLDLDPLWRIGATAARLTSLAESRGSRFRGFVAAFCDETSKKDAAPESTNAAAFD